MGHEFTRRELYDLVWSQPMKTVAASVGISGVALAKACRRANIPVPPRGYWARKRASKSTIQAELPPRFPGTPDKIEVGSTSRLGWGPDWQEKALNEPIPPPPTFDENMDSVTARVRELVGKVSCPRNFNKVHPLVAKLLAHDNEHRADFLRTGYSWYAPKYDSGVERRRLLILNAILLTVQALGCKPVMNTSRYGQDSRDDREIRIQVGQQFVSFTLEPLTIKRQAQPSVRQRERLRLALGSAGSGSAAGKSWDDTEGLPLERILSRIVEEILVAAEISYRDGCVRQREWMIERKAQLEEEIRRRKAEEEREKRKLLEKQAKERIDRLLAQAKALDQSNTIRAYVQAVRDRIAELLVNHDDFEKWASWALGEADRIDPVRNRAVIDGIEELSCASSEPAK